MALGFAVAIEGTIIQMMPLSFPLNLIAYFVLGAITFWLFICSGWFQNKLVAMKLRYEEKGR